MEYQYADAAKMQAKLFDDAARFREMFTGMRNGLIEDGWSPEGAEQVIIQSMRMGQQP